ncbi:MAG: hypothetical protein F6K39_06895 [Okeania sp. SIO3B3]|nr:hypothetical protein [Okeania sp. SIO3B3]
MTNKIFVGANAIVAISAAFFGIFARKPVGKEDVSLAVEKVLLNYDNETFLKLKKAKEEEKEIRDYIENRSNEIFLLKLRSYLVEEIEAKYRGSDLAKLITDLEQIENQLDSMQVVYGDTKLPERFKEVLRDFNQQEDKVDIYLELFALLPPPLNVLFRTLFRLLAFLVS